MSVGAGALARTAFGVAIVAAVAASTASSRASAAAPAGPFAADLAAAEARLDASRGKPEAIVALDELLALEDDLPDGALEPALRRAAAAGADPLVAAQATFQLARLLGQRGANDEADAARASLGFFTRVSVAGAFGEGRSGFSQVFAPEGEADAPAPERTYRGRLGDVTWRAADGVVREGALLLDGLLRPDTQATAYVVVFAKSARDRDVALRFGSPGPTKIWVDGARVFARDVVRTPIFDQDAAPARLRAGWNRIVVKTTITEGPWRVYLRVTDPAGHALALGDGALPAGAKVARAGAARRAPAIVTLEAELRRRASATSQTGQTGDGAWFDLGRYLASAGPGDRDSREAAAALETARARQPTVATLRLLADVARDEDERRRSLEAALALPGGAGEVRARILAALGDTARSQRRDDVALARWRDALATDPGCWPATLALADEEQAAGLTSLALARVEALPEAARQVARVRRQWARLLDAVGRVREADALLQGMRATRQRDVELLHELATRARGRGDGATFVAELARAAALRPDLPSLELEHARALEGAGDDAAARDAMTALAARLPDDASVLAHLGKLLHRQGRRDEAL
ncbi:MAG TPA: hypothetical protein VK989_16120, partial [Polyangia bacterium]|nr:hypothetical protein [Polyangia bacterium]